MGDSLTRCVTRWALTEVQNHLVEYVRTVKEKTMKKNKDGQCCVAPIPGAVNQPKMTSDAAKPIANAVAWKGMKQVGLARIPGAVNGPK